MTQSPPVSPSSAADKELARIVEEWTAKAQAGGQLDVEGCALAHPEYASELRRLLPALALLANLSRSGPKAVEGLVGIEEEDPASRTLGDYRILREVGRGGMGVVYEAEQISLGRRVALKVLPFAATMDPRHLQRFHNEARAAACLHHPHIVPVYAVGCERGVHFYAMQFIEGWTLAELIARQRLPQPRPAEKEEETAPIAAAPTEPAPRDARYFRRVAEWGVRAAEALEHAHALGVVHRDVKPANLMIDEKDRVWVTDFGLARTAADAGLTMTGDLVGTLRYMSPEQALARHGLVDHRTDTYSLGATLYELVTLEPPFQGDDRQDILRQIAEVEPRPLRRARPATPVDLETIVLKALAKEPIDRYATAQELADDLQRFMKDEPVRARRPTLLQRMGKWAWRHRLALVWTLLVAAVAAAGILAGFLAHNRELYEAARRERERADEAERLRAEASAHLYHSLLREAKALRLARVVGHRQHAWSRLQQALAVDTSVRNLDELRCEAVAGMGDFVGLKPAVLDGFPEAISAIAVHPRANQLAVGLADGSILLYRASDGREVDRLRPHRSAITALAFAPAADALVAADASGTVLVCRGDPAKGWKPESGSEWAIGPVAPRVIPGMTPLAFSPDTECVAACNSSEVTVWRRADRKAIGKFRAAGVSFETVSFNGDGSLLAAGYSCDEGEGPGVRVWEVATGRLVQDLRSDLGGISTVAFSPNSRHLNVSCAHGIAVMDAKFRPSLSVPGDQSHGMCFSPDGKWFAFFTLGGTVRLWSVATRREVAVLRDPSNSRRQFSVKAVTFGAGGRFLAAAGPRSVTLWDLEGASEKRALAGHDGGVTCVVFSPDGKQLATSSKDRTVRIWDFATGQLLRTTSGFQGATQSLAFSPDGQWLVTADSAGQIKLLDVRSGKEQDAPDPGLGRQIWSVAFSPDGKWLAAGSEEGRVAVWQVVRDGADGAPSPVSLRRTLSLTFGKGIRNVCFSPDRPLLAVAERERRVLHCWDVAAGRPGPTIPARHVADVQSTAFSRDGALVLFVTPTGTVEGWQLTTSTKELTLGQPGAFVGSGLLALRPCGRWFAAAPSPETIAIWDITQRKQLLTLPEERAMIWSFAWSPTGQHLAVGLADGGLSVWDLTQLREKLATAGLDW